MLLDVWSEPWLSTLLQIFLIFFYNERADFSTVFIHKQMQLKVAGCLEVFKVVFKQGLCSLAGLHAGSLHPLGHSARSTAEHPNFLHLDTHTQTHMRTRLPRFYSKCTRVKNNQQYFDKAAFFFAIVTLYFTMHACTCAHTHTHICIHTHAQRLHVIFNV